MGGTPNCILEAVPNRCSPFQSNIHGTAVPNIGYEGGTVLRQSPTRWVPAAKAVTRNQESAQGAGERRLGIRAAPSPRPASLQQSSGRCKPVPRPDGQAASPNPRPASASAVLRGSPGRSSRRRPGRRFSTRRTVLPAYDNGRRCRGWSATNGVDARLGLCSLHPLHRPVACGRRRRRGDDGAGLVPARVCAVRRRPAGRGVT